MGELLFVRARSIVFIGPSQHGKVVKYDRSCEIEKLSRSKRLLPELVSLTCVSFDICTLGRLGSVQS